MDLSPHFQPYSSAEAEQAGFKTGMETCGGVHLIFQRGFPFQPCSSHFGRDFPLLSWPASSVVVLNKSGFALQSPKCCHLQQYLGTAEISRWSEGLLFHRTGHVLGEETRHLRRALALAQVLRQASPKRWRLIRQHHQLLYLTSQLLD